MMLCGRELMVPPCTDSTFDNEEEMHFFQLKPQTTFEDKKQTAKFGAPSDEGERKKKKKKKIRGPV